MKEKMYESEVKAMLVDYLLAYNQEDFKVIVDEFVFADGKRRADLATIGEEITAYEIKGDKDNLTKLDNQIKDYVKYFSSIVIVCTKKHLKHCRSLSSNVGIILVENNGVKQIRKPTIKKTVRNEYLVEHLDRNFIVKNFKQYLGLRSGPTLIGISEMYKIVAKSINNKDLFKIVIKYLTLKYLAQYEAFIKERGQTTTQDDLILLKTQPTELII